MNFDKQLQHHFRRSNKGFLPKPKALHFRTGVYEGRNQKLGHHAVYFDVIGIAGRNDFLMKKITICEDPNKNSATIIDDKRGMSLSRAMLALHHADGVLAQTEGYTPVGLASELRTTPAKYTYLLGEKAAIRALIEEEKAQMTGVRDVSNVKQSASATPSLKA